MKLSASRYAGFTLFKQAAEKKRTFIGGFWALLLSLLISGCAKQEGKILNAADNTPIPGATIYHNGQVTQSDATGGFKLEKVDTTKPMLVKAVGFRRASVPLKKYIRPEARMESVVPKALFLSHAGVGAAYLRDPVMQQLDSTDLNAVVVDVKGDRGLFSFSWEIPVGHKIGAFSKITIDDPDAFIRGLHEKNIYVIGRVCVFKDEALGNNKPEWAAMYSTTNKVFRESDKIPWMDPFREEVWDYNIAIAKAAAEVGFDEIQFDQVRFPLGDAKFSREATKESRVQAVTNFLTRAKTELQPYNVYISVAVSGDTIWKSEDTKMGVDFAAIAPLVDYVSPYIYPSSLPSQPLGLKGNLAKVPGETVAAALGLLTPKFGNQAGRLRPWLQGFKDYSRLRLEFKEEEIAAEIAACAATGTSGWMLFNPENKYPYISGALEKVKQGVTVPTQTAQAEPQTVDAPSTAASSEGATQ